MGSYEGVMNNRKTDSSEAYQGNHFIVSPNLNGGLNFGMF